MEDTGAVQCCIATSANARHGWGNDDDNCQIWCLFQYCHRLVSVDRAPIFIPTKTLCNVMNNVFDIRLLEFFVKGL